ncbi:MAG: hypothetical protein ACXWLB_12875 [Reyranella sp.]
MTELINENPNCTTCCIQMTHAINPAGMPAPTIHAGPAAAET